MTQRQYDAATAQALMKLAYQEDNGVAIPYIKRDEGLYANESFREVCPPGTVFDWTPADEMHWPGSPNPNTAPFLPVPFTANELAACMLDGPGQSIQFTLDRRIGYPLDAGALDSIHARHRWMRDALEEAYALAAAAQLVVGEFDHDEEARAHALAQQYSDANGQANDREGVFGQGITPDEARARRARAVASVADLKVHARRAQATVADKWKAWRKDMVRQLLQPQKNANSAPHWDELTSEQRMKRAIELDHPHDPEMQQEKTHFWGLLDLIDGKKSEIAKWEAMPEPLPSEALAKEQRLLVLRGELVKLETRFNEPYPAPPVADTALPVPVVAASDGPAPLTTAPAWSLKTPPARTPGYRWPLYQFLQAAHVAGKPCPKAQDVLDGWKLNPPHGLRVIQCGRRDALKYELIHGGEKTADLRAIQATIKGLIVRIG